MSAICTLAFLMALATAAGQKLKQDDLEYQLLTLTNQVKSANEEDSQYRMPKSVVPIKYDIKLVPFIVEDNFTFDGSVSIIVEAIETVQQVTLHALELKIECKLITVKELLKPFEEVPITNVVEDEVHAFYTLKLATSLKEKTSYVISIPRFTGKLREDFKGFYRRSYTVNNNTKWMTATHFQATHARQAFPCFDEPSLKARFTISISRPAGLRAISNMPQNGQPQLDTEHTDVVRYWDHFQETPLMSTYLVAFSVSDFEYLDEKMRIFADPRLVNYTRYSLWQSGKTLDWLADYTGVDYTMPKMDQLGVPGLRSVAMENWGLVIYSANVLLLDEAAASVSAKQENVMIIAHEFAHQWFGNLATPKFWKYLWLSEGLTSYIQYLAVAAMEPTWRIDEQFSNFLQGAMSADSKLTHPITVNVSTPDEIRAIFDGISYGKAGSVLKMVESIVTPATMRKGLQHYLKSKSFSSATGEDLFDSLSKQMLKDNITYDGVDLKEVMRKWTRQPGFPLLTVDRNYDDGSAILTQRRYLTEHATATPDELRYKWYIPLTYTTEAESDFRSTRPKLWMHPEDQSLRVENLGASSEWSLFNVKAIGFYRVNYDEQNWALLTAHLKSPAYQTIPPLNRAQLVDDAFNLARGQTIPYRVALLLSTYLRQEIDFIVWSAANRVFKPLAEKFQGTPGSQVFTKFRRYLGHTLEAIVGFEGGPREGDVARMTRRLVARRSCQAGDKECVDRACRSVRQWMETTSNMIDPDLREEFYCAAVRYGNSSVFDFFREQQRTSILPLERDVFVKTIGCSEDQDLLRTYLDEAVASRIILSQQDKKAVFESVYAHSFGLHVALDYVTENFKEVSKYIGSVKAVVKMIHSMATGSNVPAHAFRLKQFLSVNYKELGSYVPVIKKSIDTIKKNGEWYEATGKEIAQWIDGYFVANPTAFPMASSEHLRSSCG